MVAFLRQFLVVLLVLLQGAAPLVHAHTGGDVSQRGLHLPEFETLRLAADSMSLAAADHSVTAESCIVDVGSAIKRQHTADDSAPIFYLPGNGPGLAFTRDTGIVNFSPYTTGFIPEPFSSHNTSRAPPL